MTMDPSEKGNALLNRSRRFDSLAEQMGLSDNGTTAKTGATVQVMGNNSALISVPLAAYGDHQVTVYGRTIPTKGRITNVFSDSFKGPVPVYTKFVPVRVGAYRLHLAIKDLTTGKLVTDTIEFEVNVDQTRLRPCLRPKSISRRVLNTTLLPAEVAPSPTPTLMTARSLQA